MQHRNRSLLVAGILLTNGAVEDTVEYTLARRREKCLDSVPYARVRQLQLAVHTSGRLVLVLQRLEVRKVLQKRIEVPHLARGKNERACEGRCAEKGGQGLCPEPCAMTPTPPNLVRDLGPRPSIPILPPGSS